MAENNLEQQNQINIELPEDVADGTYANLAIIAHSQSEVVLDFIRIMPNMPKARVKSRIILTPSHAKRLMRALMDNVKKYEQQYGVIDEKENAYPALNFAPTAQA
ncbi:MAG: DUF3467 domain-containing protein [Saprospiraceae bacterium]|nr:DUF3467 domain-containing protein [Saprospiraceae bacterium]MBP7699856.1 DUF3467 domain-containing protein [Saprospiraceae bacterium]